jgi:hypothetical protein
LLPRDDAGAVDVEALAQERARQCWVEDDEFLPKDKIAEWLGGHGALNGVALRYYIDRFDFQGLRLDQAFRCVGTHGASGAATDAAAAGCARSCT